MPFIEAALPFPRENVFPVAAPVVAPVVEVSGEPDGSMVEVNSFTSSDA